MPSTPSTGDRTPPAGGWLRRGERIVCSSVDQLAAIWPSARFTSGARDFSANALALRFGGFAVETIVSSSYSCVRDEDLVARHPRAAIAIEVILEGRVQRHQQGLDYVQTAGQAAVTLLDEPFGFTWAAPGRSVRTVASLSLLPTEFGRPGAVRSGVLPTSPLVSAYIGFVSTLVDVAQPAAADDRPLEHAALGLHRAVLVEALRPQSSPGAELRTRIEQHIDARLQHPTLSPTTIASDLGVSLRSVHGAFDDADLTVAAEIRRRRVLAAAELLLGEDDAPLSAIAREVGFTSSDRLRRSFLSVLGEGPSEYRRRRSSP